MASSAGPTERKVVNPNTLLTSSGQGQFEPLNLMFGVKPPANTAISYEKQSNSPYKAAAAGEETDQDDIEKSKAAGRQGSAHGFGNEDASKQKIQIANLFEDDRGLDNHDEKEEQKKDSDSGSDQDEEDDETLEF